MSQKPKSYLLNPSHIHPIGSGRENNLEKVVQTVAVFKKPAAGAGRATYELKPEFFDEYNVFYYHYNKVWTKITQTV